MKIDIKVKNTVKKESLSNVTGKISGKRSNEIVLRANEEYRAGGRH